MTFFFLQLVKKNFLNHSSNLRENHMLSHISLSSKTSCKGHFFFTLMQLRGKEYLLDLSCVSIYLKYSKTISVQQEWIWESYLEARVAKVRDVLQKILSRLSFPKLKDHESLLLVCRRSLKPRPTRSGMSCCF